MSLICVDNCWWRGERQRERGGDGCGLSLLTPHCRMIGKLNMTYDQPFAIPKPHSLFLPQSTVTMYIYIVCTLISKVNCFLQTYVSYVQGFMNKQSLTAAWCFVCFNHFFTSFCFNCFSHSIQVFGSWIAMDHRFDLLGISWTNH